MWATKQSRKLQRESRSQQRIGDAYLQVLEYAEAEGQYFSASKFNWDLTTWDEWRVHTRRREVRPEAHLRARSAALIAAFATPSVKQAHANWLAVLEAADQAEDTLKWNAGEGYNPDELLPEHELVHFNDAVKAEREARQAMAALMSGELSTA